MSKAVLSSLVALWLLAPASPAQGNFDCDQAYKSFQEKLDRERSAKTSREQVANLRRWAQRAYDACQTGDLENPKALFERLERERY
jgi:hypothetical protein